ncbi:MAG: glycosyltransferase, partial [Novosphingobium sp.]
EQAIAALPAILERHPDAVYRILGATHPVLRARHGETYRETLMAQSEALGVADNIVWDNRFLGIEDLLEQLDACDIYLTPSLNLDQSTSGTLSYAVALGKAVVSTPYVHARELLADGVGCLIDSPSPAMIAEAVNRLLDDPAHLQATRQRAYERGRQTVWSHFAAASARMLRSAQVPSHRPVCPRHSARSGGSLGDERRHRHVAAFDRRDPGSAPCLTMSGNPLTSNLLRRRHR